jgi:5-methylcytosine-specific restriction endonuclease McrA
VTQEERRKRHRKSDRKYRTTNLSKIRAKNRAWVKQNPDKAYRNTKRWRRANPETLRLSHVVSNANKNAKLHGARSKITLKQFIALLKKFGNVCVCCGKPGPLGCDHVVPLSKGGSHSIRNIQPMLPACNRRKRTRSTDFRQEALARLKTKTKAVKKLKTQKDNS